MQSMKKALQLWNEVGKWFNNDDEGCNTNQGSSSFEVLARKYKNEKNGVLEKMRCSVCKWWLLGFRLAEKNEYICCLVLAK